jgi:hypothetical protein
MSIPVLAESIEYRRCPNQQSARISNTRQLWYVSRLQNGRCDVHTLVRLITSILLAVCIPYGSAAHGQLNDRQNEPFTTLCGRVLNALTREPLARALVLAEADNAAAFTDDRGQFELKILENNGSPKDSTGTTVVNRFIQARKPGFLQEGRMITTSYAPGSMTPQHFEVTLRLTPEALIVGHLGVPGSEGEVRIQCQLYRREIRDGREYWSPERVFTTWADGEFRFSDLKAGIYKLITHEQMDRDSALAIPSTPLYGYPPMYYPNTTDFSVASPIVVKAGQTARVNLTVTRRPYYPVKINVENMPVGQGMDVRVYPMGHHSPGWSLGYNPAEDVIEGVLPEGTYTVEASAPGKKEVTGILNFSVRGRPLEGATLNLLPDATVTVRVREEFQSQPSNFFNVETAPGNPQLNGKRSTRVQVILASLDELGGIGGGPSQLPDRSQGQELIIPNVRPGRYQVNVTGSGYPASIQAGGKDLTRQPLVVGLGGEVAPIEILLRDDGAELTVSLEENDRTSVKESSPSGVALLPLGESGGHLQNSPSLDVKQRVLPELDVAYSTTYYGGTTESEAAAPIELKAGENREIEIRVAPVPALHFLLHVPADTPAPTDTETAPQVFHFPTFRKRVFDSVESVSPAQTHTVAPGVLEVTGIPADRYDVSIQSTDPTEAQQFSEIDLQRDGQDLNTTQGTTLSKLTVTLRGEQKWPRQYGVGLLDAQHRMAAFAQGDGNGQASFDAIKPGKYSIVVMAPAKRYAVSRTISGTTETPGHEVNVVAGVSMEVTADLVSGTSSIDGVVKKNSKPIAGIMVALVPNDPDSHLDLFRRDQSDFDGTFTLPGVIPGTYTIVAVDDALGIHLAESRGPGQVYPAWAERGCPRKNDRHAASARRSRGPAQVREASALHFSSFLG